MSDRSTTSNDEEAAINVLFDLDGTLTDSRPGIVACITHALATLQVPTPAETDLLKYVGPPLRDSFCELLNVGVDDDRVDDAIAAYRDRFSRVGMFENAVYAGIPLVLSALLSRNAALFVATSKPRVYAKQILEHCGLAECFSEVYGSELDGTLSNKAELIAHALSASGLRAEDTIMVGDRLHDIAGALRCSVFPVGVLWGYGSRVELAEAGAKKLIEAPEELLQLAV